MKTFAEVLSKPWAHTKPADLEARENALLEAHLGEPAEDPAAGFVIFLVEGLPAVTMPQGELLSKLAEVGAPLPPDWATWLDETRASGCTPVLTCVEGHCNIYGFEPVTAVSSESVH